MRCAECGADYTTAGDSCAARFEVLLALDHSRREPWGSRHGQAFAAFVLQHPGSYARSLDAAWAALYHIYVAGNRAARVFDELAARNGLVPPEWNTPPRPAQPFRAPLVTIADLGDFVPATHGERLDAWCRATLAAWGVRLPGAGPG